MESVEAEIRELVLVCEMIVHELRRSTKSEDWENMLDLQTRIRMLKRRTEAISG